MFCKNEDAIYLEKNESDFRAPFSRDVDRILYSLAFQRYMDKTQVFSFKENDHLTKRMIHVLYVSKIARTIGRALGLNEDLIEAGALGHDLGHTPFGHVGEAILNEISLKAGCGYFNHNVHSVRLLMNIENYGKGKNITLQTLDAILCHNGELVQGLYKPVNKTKEEFLAEYENTYKDKDGCKRLIPMTLEGCVVRISDLIAYLGRDIDDAVRMNLLTWEDVPKSVTDVLGKSNKEIVNSIILDVINESKDKNYIKLSNKVYEAIKNLKNFNYENIYNNAYTNAKDDGGLKNLTRAFFDPLEYYLETLEYKNIDENLFRRDYQAFIDIVSKKAFFFLFNDDSKIKGRIQEFINEKGINRFVVFVPKELTVTHSMFDFAGVEVKIIDYDPTQLFVLMNIYRRNFDKQKEIFRLIGIVTEYVFE